AQARKVREIGCDAGQGYYFARPGPAELIAERLASDLDHGLVLRRDRGSPRVGAVRPELTAPASGCPVRAAAVLPCARDPVPRAVRGPDPGRGAGGPGPDGR